MEDKKRQRSDDHLSYVSGYSNDQNPFNDNELSKPFKWKLKEQNQVDTLSKEEEHKRQIETIVNFLLLLKKELIFFRGK